jgi:uncharacterized protein (TIGR02301 family)
MRTVIARAGGTYIQVNSDKYADSFWAACGDNQTPASNGPLELAGAAAHIHDAMKIRAFVVIMSLVACAVAANVRAGAAEVAAPFDNGLARLSEILGSLHYLRGLCGANEGNKWRGEMQSLLDAEAPNGQRRSQFIAHFNKGYRTYQESYRTCTPAAISKRGPRSPARSRPATAIDDS